MLRAALAPTGAAARRDEMSEVLEKLMKLAAKRYDVPFETLSGPGPFTVFAPTDDAFALLQAGTVENLLKPENKAMLTKVLTCHVVAADAMSMAIKGMIDDDGGTHPVPTVGGCTLQATYMGDEIMLRDERGRTAKVTIADVQQSNGVIHVIDTVLLPAM